MFEKTFLKNLSVAVKHVNTRKSYDVTVSERYSLFQCPSVQNIRTHKRIIFAYFSCLADCSDKKDDDYDKRNRRTLRRLNRDG